MAKMYGKVIETPEQIELYAALKQITAAYKSLAAMEKEYWMDYRKIEGKYAIQRVGDEWSRQGYRGYDYIYATPEDKAKEQEEMRIFYQTYLVPAQKNLDALAKESAEINEALCQALWGFGTEEYHLRSLLKEAETQLQKSLARVEEIKARIENLHNGA